MELDDLEPLRAITTPDAIGMPPSIWIFLMVAGLLFLLMSCLVIKILYQTSRKQPWTRILLPFEKALQRLRDLRLQEIDVRSAALESSLIFRELLKEETGDRALYETHEEFSMRPDALETIPVSMREETRHYIQKLARLKYTPAQMEGESTILIDEAIDLVQKLLIEIRKETARKKQP